MKTRTILLLLILLPFCTCLEAGVWDKLTGYFKGSKPPEPPTIRVLLLHDVQKANLQIRGRYSLYDPYTNSHISTRFAGKSRTIEADNDGLKWGESFPGLYQIKIQPDEDITLISLDGHDYEDDIYVYDIGGTLSVVNQIPVENFVRTVLLNHLNQSLEPEALAALAIVARTNAYYQAMNPKNTYWAVDAQKIGFQGRVSGNYSLDNAVKQTRYMIMSRTGVYEGVATPFAAQFGGLSPGQTKDVQVANITLEEANEMAKRGDHAAQILAKAFPGTNIMIMQYAK